MPLNKGGSERTVSVFEADRPKVAGADTRVTRDQAQYAWADRWSSRFAKAYDYAADLRHIARCTPDCSCMLRLAPSYSCAQKKAAR